MSHDPKSLKQYLTPLISPFVPHPPLPSIPLPNSLPHLVSLPPFLSTPCPHLQPSLPPCPHLHLSLPPCPHLHPSLPPCPHLHPSLPPCPHLHPSLPPCPHLHPSLPREGWSLEFVFLEESSMSRHQFLHTRCPMKLSCGSHSFHRLPPGSC